MRNHTHDLWLMSLRLGTAAGADTKLPKHMDEQCREAEYAKEHYGACCAKGGYKMKGRKEACRKAKKMLVKSKTEV